MCPAKPLVARSFEIIDIVSLNKLLKSRALCNNPIEKALDEEGI